MWIVSWDSFLMKNDVTSIDNDTREKKNKIVSFHLFLWKIATLYTGDDHWKNGFNDKRRYGCVSVNQFSSLTGKKNTGLRQWPLILLLFTRKASSTFSVEKEENIQILIQPGKWMCFCFFCLLLQFYALDHWKILDSTTTLIITITNAKIISSKKIISDKSKTNLYNSIFKRSPKYHWK